MEITKFIPYFHHHILLTWELATASSTGSPYFSAFCLQPAPFFFLMENLGVSRSRQKSELSRAPDAPVTTMNSCCILFNLYPILPSLLPAWKKTSSCHTLSSMSISVGVSVSFPLMSFSLLCGSHGVHPCSYVRFETLPFGVRFHAYFLASQLPNSVTMTRPHLLPSAKWNLHCLVIKVLCGLNKIQIVLYLYVL